MPFPEPFALMAILIFMAAFIIATCSRLVRGEPSREVSPHEEVAEPND
jgi:hypothetical protein